MSTLQPTVLPMQDIAPTASPAVEAGVTAEAFERLNKTHLTMFRRVATRYLRFTDEAEDAVQDGLLLAWRFRKSFRGDATLASWVGTIIIRQCQGRIRRHKCRFLSPEVPFELGLDPVAADDTLEVILLRQRRGLVLRLAPQLPASQREFIYRVLSGKQPDMTVSRNKMAKHHAVRRLQDILKLPRAAAA